MEKKSRLSIVHEGGRPQELCSYSTALLFKISKYLNYVRLLGKCLAKQSVQEHSNSACIILSLA